VSERSRQLTHITAILGGAVYIIANVQFGLAQVVAAAAWNPPYNWLTNVISDLGNTACGQFAVHGATSYVCSPRHAVMNTSFVISGVLLIVGTLALWRMWPARRMTTVALLLLVISGVGKMIVGFVPENTNAALHTLGASNILIGSVAILLISLAVLSQSRALAITGLVISIVSLSATILWTAAQYAGPALDLGLGTGGMERLADYPTNVWLIIVGLVALLTTRGQIAPAAGRAIRMARPGVAGQ
jgi:hypothetical membrane protein